MFYTVTTELLGSRYVFVCETKEGRDYYLKNYGGVVTFGPVPIGTWIDDSGRYFGHNN